MLCSLKCFEENAQELLKRISREEYESLLESIHRSADIDLFSAVTDLTPGELSLVHSAAVYPEKNNGELITVAQAASQLNVSAPAVSRTLKNLESKGYITRNTDPSDRRSVRISVTESGYSAVSRHISETLSILNKTLESFTDEEIKTMVQLHCKFTNNLRNTISDRKNQNRKGQQTNA